MSVVVSAPPRKTRTSRAARKTAPAPPLPEPKYVHLSPLGACGLPFFLSLGLAGFGLLQSIRDQPRLFWSFEGAALVLLAWTIALFASAVARQRSFLAEISLRPQHYLQACAQGSVLLYWGWYWPQVYESAPLLVAQLLFAYATEMLLIWSRRSTYTIGFSLFPVVFSINLFLWFKPDWFYLQFDGGRGHRGQGTDSLGQRRAPRAHLQPVGVHARALLDRLNRHRRERHHVG